MKPGDPAAALAAQADATAFDVARLVMDDDRAAAAEAADLAAYAFTALASELREPYVSRLTW